MQRPPPVAKTGRVTTVVHLAFGKDCATPLGRALSWEPAQAHPPYFVAGIARDQRWRDDLTRHAFRGEIAVQPVATRAGFIRDLQGRGFPLQPTHKLIDIDLAAANFPDEHGGAAPPLA